MHNRGGRALGVASGYFEVPSQAPSKPPVHAPIGVRTDIGFPARSWSVTRMIWSCATSRRLPRD